MHLDICKLLCSEAASVICVQFKNKYKGENEYGKAYGNVVI